VKVHDVQVAVSQRSPWLELKELVRETGGSNSGKVLGGGTGDPTGLTSRLDVDATTFSENEWGLPRRFGGTGGGTLCISGM
jgi:hypothetical protein